MLFVRGAAPLCDTPLYRANAPHEGCPRRFIAGHGGHGIDSDARLDLGSNSKIPFGREADLLGGRI